MRGICVTKAAPSNNDEMAVAKWTACAIIAMVSTIVKNVIMINNERLPGWFGRPRCRFINILPCHFFEYVYGIHSSSTPDSLIRTVIMQEKHMSLLLMCMLLKLHS